MSTDIVERLRVIKSPSFEYEAASADGMVEAKWVPTRLAQEAADEIERLRVAEAILRKVALWEPAVFDEFFKFTDAERAVLAALTTETPAP